MATKKNGAGLGAAAPKTSGDPKNAPKGTANVSLGDRAVSDRVVAVPPAELLALRAWLVWRWEPNPRQPGKPLKVPYYTNGRKRTGKQGSPSDLARLATFEQAAQVVGTGNAAGLGLAMLPAHGLTAFDFDRKDDTKNPLNEAEVRALLPDCYIERSPSGKGFRAFVDGRLHLAKGARGIEAFSDSQFVTVTGNALEGVPSKLGVLTVDLRQRIESMAATKGLTDHDGDLTPALKPLDIDLVAARELIDTLPEEWFEDRPLWLKVGMVLHHEFGGSAEALHLWDHWSQRSMLKYESQACLREWASFGRRTGHLATIASLVRHAKSVPRPVLDALAAADFSGAPLPPAPSVSSPAPASRQLVIVGADEIDIESIDWLWPGRLPRGFLSVYAADGGSGKSTVTAAIAAVLTRGGTWPDDDVLAARRPPSDVLWLGIEDPLAQVTVPRLMAAGADLSRVQVLKGVSHPGQDGEALFSLQDDLALLRDWVRKMRDEGRDVSMIVVDPVTSYLHGKRRIDPYKATELRSVLQPFATLAEEENVAVICITHLTKDKSRGFIDSVLGSQALTALARNVWGFARVPGEDDNSFAMFWGKGNLGAVPPSLRYSMGGAEVLSRHGEVVATSKVVWGSEDQTVTRETIYGGSRGPLPDVRNEVAAWLRRRLQDGQWHDATTVKDEALAAGFSAATIRRASEEVCERKQHRGRGLWRLFSGS